MSNPPFPGKVPKMDVIYMTRRQTPECERVSVCAARHWSGLNPDWCQRCRHGEKVTVCARHGCPWPNEGECPTKERPLGRPPLGTTGGPFPVG